MTILMIGDISFNSDSVKVMKRIRNNNECFIFFYVNIGDIGSEFELKFPDLLSKDDKASKIAYDFLLCYLINKRSGLVNLEKLLISLNKLYRCILEKYSSRPINTRELQVLRENILMDYSNLLVNFAESLI